MTTPIQDITINQIIKSPITTFSNVEIVRTYNTTERAQLTSSKDSYQFATSYYSKCMETYEKFIVLLLDQKNQIIAVYEHTHGGGAYTIVDKKFIFTAAILNLSSNIILCHNHPSGNTQPSKEDINITNEIKKGAEILGLKVIDHIILTQNDYFSFADDGLI